MKFNVRQFIAGAISTLAVWCCGSVQEAQAQPFVHPGLLHTQADFDRMKTKVAAGAEPWTSGWNVLVANPRSGLGWNPRPVATVIRGGTGQNYAQFYPDVHAAYQTALRWKVSGDTAYANKSIDIMNQWSAVLTSVQGNADRFLAAGIYGYEFANAAEIMRTYPGWAPADFARFQNMMVTVFYPMNHDFLVNHNTAAITNYWANWDLCNMASMEAIGVLCDRRDIYNEALEYFKNGAGNGEMERAVYYQHPGYLGQWQEAGRDQGHATLGIALMGPICEMAWNQGDDLYGYDNNRFLMGAEYIAKYNLNNDVPFETYNWGTGQAGTFQSQTVVSAASRGNIRPVWELVLNHYANRKGIATPYSSQFAAQMRPEGGGGNYGPDSGGFDQLGFGTLTFTRDPQVANPTPSGLSAHANGSAVVLSWWGCTNALSYNVKRSLKAGGPYTTLATGITDLLTYSDSTATNGQYYYVVTGTLANGETGASNEVKASLVPDLQTQLKFDETTGTVASDAIANARPGTLVNGATWVTGQSGNAVSLDGTNDYVSLPTGVTSTLGDFTISTWVYLNSSQTWARIFDFGHGTDRYLFLTPRANSGKVRFVVGTVYGYNDQTIEGTSALPTNQWVHVAVTLSGHTGTLYVNGAAVGTNVSIDFPPFQLGATPQNWIGRSQFPADPYLNGKVDDFRIYNGALTASQVAQLASPLAAPVAPTGGQAVAGNHQVSLSWNAVSGSTGYNIQRATVNGGPYSPVATVAATTSYLDDGLANGLTYYYVVSAFNVGGESPNSAQAETTLALAYIKFDESNVTTASDATGHGWNGSLVNTPGWVSGKINNAVSLNGTNQYVALASSSSLPSALSDFTIAVWVNPTANGTWARIFDFGAGTTKYMFLTAKSGSGNLRFAITTSGNGSEQQINAASALPTGTWSHVVVTHAGNLGILYVNGVEVGRNASMTLTPMSLGGTTQNWLGRSQFAADPYFNGKLDDLRICDVALTPQEVTLLYQQIH